MNRIQDKACSNPRQTSDTKKIRAADLANWMLSHGITSATTAEVAEMLGVPLNHVPQRLAPLRRRNEIVSLAHGLWIPVRPEFITWGAPPAVEVIDDLMRFLRSDYYVGWLSAAAIHGAAHHAPQVFQVATSNQIKARSVGRSRMEFFKRSLVGSLPTVGFSTNAGMAKVSSPAVTMLDVASDPHIAAGLSNAAGIVVELHEGQGAETMAEAARLAGLYPASAARRLGWLLEAFAEPGSAETLHEVVAASSAAVSLLDPTAGWAGTKDRRWQLLINTEVEPEV